MPTVNYNRFGAAYADVIALYPGTQDLDYGTASGAPDATAGQTAINAALDKYSRLAAATLPMDHYNRIVEPQGELIVSRATAAQSSANLGLFPVVAGSVHLYRFGHWPSCLPTPIAGESTGYSEITSSEYSVTASTGAIDLSSLSTALTAGEMIFATYQVDTADAAFTMPSLKDIILVGAAAELGARIYSQAVQEWKLVEDYRNTWADWVKRAEAGDWVPDELRVLSWWNEAEKAPSIGSVRIGRG